MSAGGRPRPVVTDHAFVGDWGPAVPHQYLAGCLWSSGRRQKGNIPMPGHKVLSGDHHDSIVIIAVLLLCAFSGDMGPCIGVESDVTIPPPRRLGIHD
jgi:hypothetical protein